MRRIGTGLGRRILHTVGFLSGGALLGTLALVLVYGLPVEKMQEHVRQSLPMLEQEFAEGEAVTGYPASIVGTFTDCLMLGNAVYSAPGHSILEQALQVYRAESGQGEGWAPGNSLVDYLNGAEGQRELEYSRYWHGYLVFLKPLLAIMTVNGIRMLAAILQVILLGAVLISCMKRGESGLAASFLVSIPFFYFFALYQSLSLSVCFYIMAFLLLIQLKYHEKLEKGGLYCDFFLLGGMATSYFDFLTYPLVTLGFPLCVFLYLGKDPVRKRLQKMAAFGVEWGVGYGGLWALKWILADLFVQGDTIANAGGALWERTGTVAGVDLLTVWWKNIVAYRNHAFVVFGLGILLWLCCCMRRNEGGFRKALEEGGAFLLVGALPFLWFGVTQNHSYEHAVFTYRILSVTVFSLCCAVTKGRGPKRGKDQRE